MSGGEIGANPGEEGWWSGAGRDEEINEDKGVG